MDTKLYKIVDNIFYNKANERLIMCRNLDCGSYTTMLGTGLCDSCWEEQRRNPTYLPPAGSVQVNLMGLLLDVSYEEINGELVATSAMFSGELHEAARVDGVEMIELFNRPTTVLLDLRLPKVTQEKE